MNWRRTLTALAIATIAVSGALVMPSASADPVGPLDTPADLAAALAAEERILDHFHYGQIHEQHYNTPARVTGDIRTTVGENDSALYTGNYLGAEAFRYALAKKKIASGVDVPFWTAQRNDAKARVDKMVDKFHMLINISQFWKTNFKLKYHADKPLTNGGIDFGGGIFKGEKGLLFRACSPTPIDPGMEFADLGRNPSYNRLVGPLNWVDGKNYYCFDATSRDAYAGTTFGLLTALDLVSTDDPAMRRMIRDDIFAMTNFALKYLWNTPRPHGTVVLPEVEGGNDLDNFISPLFVYTAVAQLNMTQIARHAARVAGSPTQKLYWETVWLAELAANGPQLSASMLVDAAQRHDSYYKYHLNYLTLFNMIRVEPNPLVRDSFRRALNVMDASLKDDMNALYDSFVYAFTGDPNRLAKAVDHHRQWLLYKARNDASGNQTHHLPRCSLPAGDPNRLECIPQLNSEMLLPPLPPTMIPELPTPSGQLRSRFPLPIKDRKAQDFMWQKDPTLLEENQAAEWESPGADFLLPYWMIRYYSEAAPPPQKALPAYVGPTFR